MYNEYNHSVEDYMMQGTLTQFLHRVFGWMGIALFLSAAVAYYVSTVPAIYMTIFSNPGLLFGLFILQFGLVMMLGLLISRLSYSTAVALFLVYAASLGLTLSSIFIYYKISSIAVTFFVTASMFVMMALYGYFTKADLSSLRSISTMALFGLIIGFLINMFLKSPMVDYVLSAIGVIIFTALTAADMQKIKQLGYQIMTHQPSQAGKAAVLGALTLYLDFINLFLLLLRFTGRRQD